MNYKRALIKLSDKLNDGKSAEEFQENAWILMVRIPVQNEVTGQKDCYHIQYLEQFSVEYFRSKPAKEKKLKARKNS